MDAFILAIFQLIGAVGIVGFWIYFFLVENKNPDNSEVYLAFERSFPVPDLLWLTPILIVAAMGLIFGGWHGIFFTIAAGSALIFLGLLDISFNIQQGGYKKKISDAIMNFIINGFCIALGISCLVFASQHLL
ncbi:MAG: hypothetical protein ACTSRH_10430 [Promethearchaeota archaeon]